MMKKQISIARLERSIRFRWVKESHLSQVAYGEAHIPASEAPEGEYQVSIIRAKGRAHREKYLDGVEIEGCTYAIDGAFFKRHSDGYEFPVRLDAFEIVP